MNVEDILKNKRCCSTLKKVRLLHEFNCSFSQNSQCSLTPVEWERMLVS